MQPLAASPIPKTFRPGERLLWSGQPRRGLRLRRMDVFLVPVSLLWLAFTLAWEATAISNGAPLYVVLFGSIFVVSGLYVVFGRFIADAMARERTFYALTTERAIITTGLFAQRTVTLQLRTVMGIDLEERRDGSGTVIFGPVYPMMWLAAYRSWSGGGQYAVPTFEMIEQVRTVYGLAQNAQVALRRRAESR